MIYSILQKNSPVTFILYPIFLLGIWASFIIEPTIIEVYYDAKPMPLYSLLLSVCSTTIVCSIVLLATILLNAFILSQINNSFRLIEKRTSINIFLFFLLSGSFLIFKQYNPLHFALLFILLGIYSLFKIYKNERALQPVFEAGLCIAIASLFYANALFFGLFIFVALTVLLPFNWRQWAAGIFGLSTPILIVFSIFFLRDSVPDLVETIHYNITVWHRSFTFGYPHYIFIGIISILFLRSLGHLFSGTIRKISTRKYYTLLLFFIILTTIIFFSVPAANKEIFFFIIPSVSFIISNYLENIRSRFWQELLFILIIGSIVLLQVVAK